MPLGPMDVSLDTSSAANGIQLSLKNKKKKRKNYKKNKKKNKI